MRRGSMVQDHIPPIMQSKQEHLIILFEQKNFQKFPENGFLHPFWFLRDAMLSVNIRA